MIFILIRAANVDYLYVWLTIIIISSLILNNTYIIWSERVS